MLNVTVITDPSAFYELQEEWTKLFVRAEPKSVPLCFEWCSSWWEVYGAERARKPGGLRIFAFRDKDSLVGLLPLFLEYPSRALRFISSGGSPGNSAFPEYVDLLSLPERAEECLQEFCRLISQPEWRREWLSLDLAFSMEGSALERHFRDRRCLHLPVLVRQRYLPSPFAILEEGFEDYIRRVGSWEKHFRRLLRQAERLALSFRTAESEKETGEILETLIHLHQKQWSLRGESGAFQSDAIREFHRKVTTRLQESGKIFLGELSENGSPIAVIYGFIIDKRFELYQSGMVDASKTDVKSPGILAHLLSMEHLAQRGITVYDLLGGEAEYKSRFAKHHNTLIERQLIRLTLRTLLQMALRLLHRGGRKVQVFLGGNAAPNAS